jgi:hypothetical protein
VNLRRITLILIVLAGWAVPAPALAETKIWSAVILASNSPEPKESPEVLRPVFQGLKRFFGYNQFEILGSSTMSIEGRVEQWLVPTEHFWLSVRARKTSSKDARGGYLLDLELFHDKRPLVATEARLSPESPLFIRGPVHATGQVLVVLQVQR